MSERNPCGHCHGTAGPRWACAGCYWALEEAVEQAQAEGKVLRHKIGFLENRLAERTRERDEAQSSREYWRRETELTRATVAQIDDEASVILRERDDAQALAGWLCVARLT
jgi:hypothetical protein